jgi:hypothetical protein
MELGIRLSFVKTSEFRGGGFTPLRYAPAAAYWDMDSKMSIVKGLVSRKYLNYQHDM